MDDRRLESLRTGWLIPPEGECDGCDEGCGDCDPELVAGFLADQAHQAWKEERPDW